MEVLNWVTYDLNDGRNIISPVERKIDQEWKFIYVNLSYSGLNLGWLSFF